MDPTNYLLTYRQQQPGMWSTGNVNALLHKMPVERGSMFPLTTYADGSTRYDPNNGSIIGDAIRAFTFPGRALQGQVQPQGMADEAANFGLSVGLGSLAGVRPRGALGMGGRPGKGLDMSQEARMARAKEMGFDTGTVWYHGSTSKDLDQITPGYKEPGAWFTTDMMNASNYARGVDAGMYKVHLKNERPFTVEFVYGSDGSLRPMHNGKHLEFENNIDIVKYAERNGYDSVHFPEGNFSESGNTMVIFDPSNIRSVDAKFDQAMSASPNLMAANAPTAALPGLISRYYGGNEGFGQ